MMARAKGISSPRSAAGPESGTGRAGVVRGISALRDRIATWRRGGRSWALVPTMGALHAGHTALIRAARQACDHTVVSIFVNPAQFGPEEDFAAYPRDEGRDRAILAEEGVDVAWIPGLRDIYPPGFATQVRLDSLADCLCAVDRPDHFPGVATVVARLLQLCRPREAFFGEKDYQQWLIIRTLARDLAIDSRIRAVATVREDDGLALSSRNAYLDSRQRRIAPRLYHGLIRTAEEIARGGDVDTLCSQARADLLQAGFEDVAYVECRDAESLRPAPRTIGASPHRWRLFGAARLGQARLIDNVPLAGRPDGGCFP